MRRDAESNAKRSALTRFCTNSVMSSPAAGMNAPTAAIPAAPAGCQQRNRWRCPSPPIPSTGCPAAASTISLEPSLIQIIDRRLRSCRHDRPGNEQVRGLSCSDRRDCVHGAADHEARRRDAAHLGWAASTVLSGEHPTLWRPSATSTRSFTRTVVACRRRQAISERTRLASSRGFEVGFPDLDQVDACARRPRPPAARSSVEPIAPGARPWPRPAGGGR